MKIGKVPYILLAICCLACMLFLFLFHNASDITANRKHYQEVVLPKAELPQTEISRIDQGQEPINLADGMKGTDENQTLPLVGQSLLKGNHEKVAEDFAHVDPEGKGIEKEITYHKGRILVKFTPEEIDEIEAGKIPDMYGRLGRMVSRGGFYEVIPNEGESVEELIEQYRADSSQKVQYAQLDYECEVQGLPASELLRIKKDSPEEMSDMVWYLDAINIEEAWERTTGSKKIVVAILDTGIAYENFIVPGYESDTVDSDYYLMAPYLSETKIWMNKKERRNNKDDDKNGYVDDKYGYDFVNEDVHPNDNNGHGTHLAHIIAQSFKISKKFRKNGFKSVYKSGFSDIVSQYFEEAGAASDPVSYAYKKQYEDTVSKKHKKGGKDGSGIAPDCTIMNLKVLSYRGKGFASNIAAAIYYAVDNGAHVINMSFAWPPNLDPGPIIHDAVKYATEAGAIVISGAGNNSRSTVCYPAAYEEVIAVGAVQYDLVRAYYSNYGPELDIVAPGGNIWLDENQDTYPDGILMQTFDPRYKFSVDGETLADAASFTFEFIHGTSVATAQITGVVALMLSIEPDLTVGNIRSIFKKSALDLGPEGWDREYGYGLVDAGAALTRAVNGDYDESPGDNNGSGGGDDNVYTDLDGDGYVSIFEGGNDCDDDNPSIYPGAEEIPYDGIDQDCTGSDLLDADRDGYDAVEYGGTDCDDDNPAIHPGALEIAGDGIDQDCDGGDNTSTIIDDIEEPESCDDMDCANDCDNCSREEEIETECPGGTIIGNDTIYNPLTRYDDDDDEEDDD